MKIKSKVVCSLSPLHPAIYKPVKGSSIFSSTYIASIDQEQLKDLVYDYDRLAHHEQRYVKAATVYQYHNVSQTRVKDIGLAFTELVLRMIFECFKGIVHPGGNLKRQMLSRSSSSSSSSSRRSRSHQLRIRIVHATARRLLQKEKARGKRHNIPTILRHII